MTRVANRVHEHCRSNVLSLPGFPDFNPIVQSLKATHVPERQKSFRVSVQQHDRLVILQSLAQKWIESDATKERALEVISNHNTEYNPDGKYWLEERTGPVCFQFPIGPKVLM
jgi:hypothetical protein